MQTGVTSDRAKMEAYNSSVKQTSHIKSSTNINSDVEKVDLDYTSSSNESPEVELLNLDLEPSPNGGGGSTDGEAVGGDTGLVPVSAVNDASIKEQLDDLKSSIDTKVDELSKEVAELQDEYDTLLLALQNPVPFMQDQNDENLKKAQELEKKLKPLKEELMTMEAMKKQVDHAVELAPYTDLSKTTDFVNFVDDYSCDYQGLDYDLLRDCNYDITMYIGELMRKYTPEELREMHANEIDEFAIIEHILKDKPENIENDAAIHNFPCLAEAYEKYKYMTEDEIMMYHYLYKTGGQSKAEEYLSLIEDDINQAKGTAQALEFINGLDLTDEGKLEDSLKNLFGVSGKGVVDGIGTFFDGIANVFQNNEKLTAEDYEKMVILSYLAENSVYHDEIYEFSSALGNMVPAMVASAVVTLVATPAGGATVAGITFSATQAGAITASTLMGLSAMGNAKHQALVNGSDVLSSTLYGMFIGLSEATLGYFLGNIPGISQSAGFTLRGILQEGTEEFLQEWIDAGLQAVILGQDVDWSEVPESATKSFLMGVLMSGFLNGGQQLVNVTINGTTVEINVEKVLEYMRENNESDVTVALEALEPGILDRIFKRNTNQQQQSNISRQDIENELARISRNNPQKIPDAIQSLLETHALNGRNNATLRMICRISIEYMKANGYTPKASANIINQLYFDVLNKIGFDSYVDPDTGIRINVLKGIDWNQQGFQVDTVLDQIKSLPPECASLIKELNFYDTFNPADYYWELEYQQHDFYSSATGGHGQIDFWAPNTYNSGTVIHEMGHTADTQWASKFGVSGRISESQLWIDAMQADLATSGKTAVSEYGRSAYAGNGTLHEDFADAIRLFYTDPQALDEFPARKALLMKYLPQIETMATTYDKVYDILVNKYGKDEADWRLQKYYETGNITYITRDGGARDLMSKFSYDEYKQFIDQVEANKINDKYNSIQNSLLLCFNSLVDKYGYDQAIKNMQEFINTGDKTRITRLNGARDSIVYDVEEYREVLRIINNGSLNIRYLFPN